jgi:hypothetical protein
MHLSKFTIVCLLLSLTSSAQAVSVTIGGASDANIATDVKDASIFQNNVDNSNGAGPGMFAGTNGTSSPRRGLIEFNIAAKVPAGATITSVQLEMFLGQTAGGGAGSFDIQLHKLTSNWGEGTTGSTSTTIGATGQGFPANPGDATWNANFFGSSTWTTPGDDYSSIVSATTSVGSTVNQGYTWGSTTTMVADVQGWLDTPSSNDGWAVINANETSATTFRAFWTKETTTASLRPELVVTYTPAPEPSTLALLACGGIAAVMGYARKRRAGL